VGIVEWFRSRRRGSRDTAQKAASPTPGCEPFIEEVVALVREVPGVTAIERIDAEFSLAVKHQKEDHKIFLGNLSRKPGRWRPRSARSGSSAS
jgi:hypothetical protein